jgi:hypothetical protein
MTQDQQTTSRAERKKSSNVVSLCEYRAARRRDVAPMTAAEFLRVPLPFDRPWLPTALVSIETACGPMSETRWIVLASHLGYAVDCAYREVQS